MEKRVTFRGMWLPLLLIAPQIIITAVFAEVGALIGIVVLSVLAEGGVGLDLLSIPALLHHEDRTSMAFSIEARVPFLDHRVVEFAARIPGNMKIEPPSLRAADPSGTYGSRR